MYITSKGLDSKLLYDNDSIFSFYKKVTLNKLLSYKVSVVINSEKKEGYDANESLSLAATKNYVD